jgi:hypothetical protein
LSPPSTHILYQETLKGFHDNPREITGDNLSQFDAFFEVK